MEMSQHFSSQILYQQVMDAKTDNHQNTIRQELSLFEQNML
jgi:hypothetical protein